jgi:hypothetical protein
VVLIQPLETCCFEKDFTCDPLPFRGSGISLTEALAAAGAVYGKTFNGALSLKALAYFANGDLPNLSAATQRKLRALASEVNLKQIPQVRARLGLAGEQSVQERVRPIGTCGISTSQCHPCHSATFPPSILPHRLGCALLDGATKPSRARRPANPATFFRHRACEIVRATLPGHNQKED